jgi:hypothetical protein
MKFVLPLLLALTAAPLLGQSGGLVANRSTLNGILGTSGFTETFGGFTLSPGTAMSFAGDNSFDSTSIVDAQGPNLVRSGVTYTGTTLQWDSPGYFNAVSNEILFNSPSITITFAAPTSAFGVDVRDFSGYINAMTVTVYGPDDVTVLNTYSGITITDPAIFFGYQNPGGIGMVTLTDGGSWSPIITNLTFTPIPEPSSVALLACGLTMTLAISARRRLRMVPGVGVEPTLLS